MSGASSWVPGRNLALKVVTKKALLTWPTNWWTQLSLTLCSVAALRTAIIVVTQVARKTTFCFSLDTKTAALQEEKTSEAKWVKGLKRTHWTKVLDSRSLVFRRTFRETAILHKQTILNFLMLKTSSDCQRTIWLWVRWTLKSRWRPTALSWKMLYSTQNWFRVRV